MFLTPILPSLAVADAAWEILSKLSVSWSSRSANVTRPIARTPRSTDVAWPIAWPAWSADVRGAITGSPRTANVTRPITRLAGPTDIGSSATGAQPVSRSIDAGPRRERRCDVTGAWTLAGAR
jgi:hypothetical protein